MPEAPQHTLRLTALRADGSRTDREQVWSSTVLPWFRCHADTSYMARDLAAGDIVPVDIEDEDLIRQGGCAAHGVGRYVFERRDVSLRFTPALPAVLRFLRSCPGMVAVETWADLGPDDTGRPWWTYTLDVWRPRLGDPAAMTTCYLDNDGQHWGYLRGTSEARENLHMLTVPVR